jgi:Protein of unknown function (DUF3168)
MRAEKVTYTLLTASSGLAALVSARIYPNKLPQNTTMPSIAYQLISSIELSPIDAQAGYQIMRSRVQVTALAKNYAEIKDILEQVRLAMNYARGTIAGVQVISIVRDLVGPDQRDDDLALYLQSIDFMVTHYEI